MTIPDIPKDILFPDELNQYLRGQVQFLTHSNGMLQKNISEKDILIENYSHKINNLTAKISEYEQCADKSQTGVFHLQKNSELLEKLSLQSDTGTDVSTNSNKSDNRKLIIEQLQKELANEKNTTEDIRKKLNGARARTKVLETECFSSKTKLNSLTEKCHHDAELIKFLTNQISNMEEGQNNIRKEKQNIIQKLEEEIKNLKIEISKDKCMIDNLKEKVSDKDFRINELENEMRFGMNSAGSSSISIVSHDLLKQKNSIKQLQLEIQRLLELTADLNARLDDERNKHSEIQINYRKEKQKSSKLELKLSRIELESSMNKSTTYSSKSTSKLSATNSCHIDNNCLNLETLKNSLELAEENISVLKTRLDILQKEKELDFQRFSVILAERTGILKKSVSTGKIQE
ncbi:hypothetical protein CBL_08888 [Carabus blaptoides fortunei]